MAQRPNILFLMVDQLRADALGCHGNPVVQTPSIDALASRGVRFERVLTNLWGRPEATGRQAALIDLLIQLMAENVDPLPVREGPW